MLENGIKLYLDPVPDVKTLGFGIGVHIGTFYEPASKKGISHFLEHMLWKSNKKYTAKQISLGLELNGVISNAFTNAYLTFYLFEGLPERFHKVIDIVFSMFENEKFKEGEFEKEKSVILSEFDMTHTNPSERLIREIPKCIYGRSDYGFADPIGCRETIENITKEDVEEWKAKFYTPENMFLVLSGKFSENEVKLVKEYFEKLESNETMRRKPTKGEGSRIILKMNTNNQIYYALNFKSNAEWYVLEAFKHLVSFGLSSPVFQIIREKYGLGYAQSFEAFWLFPDESIVSFAIFGFEKEKEKFLESAKEELFEYISNEENLKEYYSEKIHLLKLRIEKRRVNIFERLEKEAYTLFKYEQNYDEYFRTVLQTPLVRIMDFINSLKDGKEVIILPREKLNS